MQRGRRIKVSKIGRGFLDEGADESQPEAIVSFGLFQPQSVPVEFLEGPFPRLFVSGFELFEKVVYADKRHTLFQFYILPVSCYRAVRCD